MSDTPAALEAKYRALLLARSGEARLEMAGSMYATARALVVASVLEADPSASPAAVRRALFLRFYGHEFDAATRERILARLGADGASEASENAEAAAHSQPNGRSAGGCRSTGLARQPRERDRWFQFHDARVREAMLAWLEEHDIEPTTPAPGTR